ncbi:hypothetical protein F5878DRAFT_599520 [Lentinula raphanica]|uniref:F-box domain-containing protein n=1 Tax=Lentinula raphanica TaxID=153919 RepID=A0AA38PLZ7_9AGAR|nr:hypothetical protein F5878DRAFT_599520 [Lentinula raphanica]
MSSLPQELIDRIIDEFHDSSQDLNTLSLVGRSWLQRARFHLFRYLTLVPQDIQAICEDYAEVKRRASDPVMSDLYLDFHEIRFLRSSLGQNPQPTVSFLSSITNVLPYVQGCRLLSDVRVGAQHVTVVDYLHNWLGFGGDEYASQCRLIRTSSSKEEFWQRQKARWDAIDLPWGRGTGIHALPFRALKFIHIDWSVFSWTPPSERGQIMGSTNPAHWPGHQLALLIDSNANTLDHVSINEYPGFQLKHYNSTSNGDVLLDLLAKLGPNIHSLSLGGLRQPFYPSFHLVRPEGSNDFLSLDPAVYPSGEEVPHAMLGDNCLPQKSSAPYLERLYLQGFDLESTSLIEDCIFNHGVFSVRGLTHLALTVMPRDYDYMFMFSKLQGSLTHLTLDLNRSTCDLQLKFSFFPKLECLQLVLHSIYLTWTHLHDMVESLSNSFYKLDGSLPIIQVVKSLHISLGPNAQLGTQGFLLSASVDEILESLVCIPSEIPESMGWSRVEWVTFDLPETILAETLPIAYSTGRLKERDSSYWWYRPTFMDP